jgi:hypothetical protein
MQKNSQKEFKKLKGLTMAFGLLTKLRDHIHHWLSFEPESEEVMPYDFNRLKHEIRSGDIILIEGRSRISSVIRTITQSPWTHAAIYIGRLIDFEDEEMKDLIRKHTNAKENTRLIIEDLMNEGTVINPLNIYSHHHIRICRPIGITLVDLNRVIEYTIRSLGQPYNVRHLFDLARFLLPWAFFPRRWGSSLFRTSTGEPESGICSSLIAEAFMSVHFPILPYIKQESEESMQVIHRNPYLFTPKDFDFSPYFEIIKYPFFNPDEPLPYYRRLPWAKQGYTHNDDGIISTPTLANNKIKKKSFFRFKKNKKNHSDDNGHSQT